MLDNGTLAREIARITPAAITEGDRAPNWLVSFARLLAITGDVKLAHAGADKRITGRMVRAPATGRTTLQPITTRPIGAYDTSTGAHHSIGRASKQRAGVRTRTVTGAIDTRIARKRGDYDAEEQTIAGVDIMTLAIGYARATNKRDRKYIRSRARSVAHEQSIPWQTVADYFKQGASKR
jgi:hypothetical protein